MVPLRFTADDADRASDEWGFNCGPGAIAAVYGLTLDELRPLLGDFEKKYYTNPTLMWEILNRLPGRWEVERLDHGWPVYGLARVQWHGPWTAPGVPARAAYGKTHWVGVRRAAEHVEIFDINAIAQGGWISAAAWTDRLVPWLLKECYPKADGTWSLTHKVRVHLPAMAKAGAA